MRLCFCLIVKYDMIETCCMNITILPSLNNLIQKNLKKNLFYFLIKMNLIKTKYNCMYRKIHKSNLIFKLLLNH